jgi:hypothetical protein
MNERLVQEAFDDELKKLASQFGLLSNQSVLSGIEKAVGLIPKPALEGIEKFKGFLRGDKTHTIAKKSVKPIYTYPTSLSKKASVEKTVIEDVLGRVGMGLGAGKSVEGLAAFGRKVTGNSRAAMRSKIEAELLKSKGSVDPEAVKSLLKKKEEAYDRIVGGLSTGATGLGLAYSFGRPLIKSLAARSAEAQQSGIQKKLLAGVGIGAVGTIGGMALHNKLSKTDSTYQV